MKKQLAVVKTLKKNFIGRKVSQPRHDGSSWGQPGRDCEKLSNDEFLPVAANSPGCDIPGVGLELKFRDLDAVSPQTIGSMSIDNIINTPWNQSSMCEKFQQQRRIYAKKGVIVDDFICDFRDPFIQTIAEEAYEILQQQLEAGVRGRYIRANSHFYFESKKESPNIYVLRTGKMKKLEAMAHRNLSTLFERL